MPTSLSLAPQFQDDDDDDDDDESEEEELEFVPRAERVKKPSAPAKAPVRKKTTGAGGGAGQSQLR